MIVCHLITGLADGGAEAVLYRLCTYPQPEHRHIVVALGPEDKYAPMLREAGVSTHCLGLARGRLTPGAIVRLYRLLRRYKPDVVQTWMYHANLVGGLAARLAGCSNVVWGLHHTTLVPGTTGKSTRIVNRLCAWLSVSIPSHIVACADSARRVHEGYGYEASKFVVVPNGYETGKFLPDATAGTAIRRELGIDQDAPVIGLVGRWHPDKDHPTLLAAFARVLERFSGARFVLAGTGCTPDNSALVALIRDHGLEGAAHLLGRRNDIPAVMNALDIHVLSSRSEAFPNVVAEAMACGTPCVVTDVGDASLIVGDTGWVVPPRNPEQLAGAIVEALRERSDVEKWKARSHAARQRILSEFSLEKMVERYHRVWTLRSA